MLQDSDILTIRSAAKLAHDQSKLTLERGTMDDLEVQRDDCEEKRNAVQTVINGLEDQLEAFRKQKRAIDDKMSDVKSLQREFSSLSADLATDAKRCNNSFWSMKKGRTLHDPSANQ
jgi:chromosome segregation ATPase